MLSGTNSPKRRNNESQVTLRVAACFSNRNSLLAVVASYRLALSLSSTLTENMFCELEKKIGQVVPSDRISITEAYHRATYPSGVSKVFCFSFSAKVLKFPFPPPPFSSPPFLFFFFFLKKM